MKSLELWFKCHKKFVLELQIIGSHYNDVIMTTMASQITSLAIVYSIVYSSADQRKHQSSVSLAFVRGKQRASNAENGSIWWRHHDITAEKATKSSSQPMLTNVFNAILRQNVAMCWNQSVTSGNLESVKRTYVWDFSGQRSICVTLFKKWFHKKGRGCSGLNHHEYQQEMIYLTWWRHQMEAYSALLVLCSLGIRRWPVNSAHKGQWGGTLMFSLICAWIND